MSTPEESTRGAAKPQRVLACVLCQQRKVKCDRKFPCKNCIGSRVQCVPAATLPHRPRRQRFPERELLDRLRRYENLLRQNNIDFEPLHKDAPDTEKECHNPSSHVNSPSNDEYPGAAGGTDRVSSPSTNVKSETVHQTKDYWDIMNENISDSDDGSGNSSPEVMRKSMVREAWDELRHSDDHLLFGWQKTAIDLSTLHPEQIQIFRLWQIYLDNVSPLLKVTHTSTLQARIVDAASNVASIKPNLAALMFGIYCMAIFSLDDSKCYDMFGSSKDHLLKKYQSGCQQALLSCGFLRSSDRDCLTAFYLFLISVRPVTDPYSLFSMLGIATRIAQRMGLHSESTCARYPPFEAEMRRRLWWSLLIFDTRICEMADYRTTVLIPTWDCSIPLNVNDFDLQPEMKEPPAVSNNSTEAILAVVRSEISNFVRHSAFHLDFINVALKTIAKDVQGGPTPEGGELITLENLVENRYIKFCNPEIPLQFMTTWVARGYIAKYQLFEHYANVARSPVQQTDKQRDTAISHALKMLECDTKLITSSLTTGYRWLVHLHFPFPAYYHIFQDLRRRPGGVHDRQTWEVISENFDHHFASVERGDFMFFKIFAKLVLQAWDACELVLNKSGNLVVPPRIVLELRQRLAQDKSKLDAQQPVDVSGMSIDDYSTSMSMPMDFGGHGMLYNMGGPGFEGSAPTGHPNIYGAAALDFDMNQLDWNTMDWNPMAGLT